MESGQTDRQTEWKNDCDSRIEFQNLIFSFLFLFFSSQQGGWGWWWWSSATTTSTTATGPICRVCRRRRRRLQTVCSVSCSRRRRNPTLPRHLKFDRTSVRMSPQRIFYCHWWSILLVLALIAAVLDRSARTVSAVATFATRCVGGNDVKGMVQFYRWSIPIQNIIKVANSTELSTTTRC